MNEEILQKVCLIINTKPFECQQELLCDIDRLIETHDESNLNKFINDINDRFINEDSISFSNSFLKEIFDLTSEEISYIVLCYFKHKQNL